MAKIALSDLTEEQLLEIVSLDEKRIAHYDWLDAEHITLSDEEQMTINGIKTRLLQDETGLMNEATMWSRGIYPLLVLAEQGDIRAWVEVALAATYGKTELSGTADGVLATVIAGIVRTPYLVTVEAKRTLESKNPRIQFYGQLLVAATLNWQKQQKDVIEIFGCYTIADIWSFARVTIQGLDTVQSAPEKPRMVVEMSREYIERMEAETILKILKNIVSRSHDA